MPRIPPSPIDRELAARLRVLRQAGGVTQADLARQVGVSHQQIQKYESGDNRITASLLLRLAAALGQAPSAFLPDLTATEPDPEAVAFRLDPQARALARGWSRLTETQRREITDLVLALGQKNADRRRAP